MRARLVMYENDLQSSGRAIIGAYIEGDYCRVEADSRHMAAIDRAFHEYCMQHGAHASRKTFAAGVLYGMKLAAEGVSHG